MKNLPLILLAFLIFISPNVVLSEILDDLVYREGIWYKNFIDVPFSGKITGQTQGTLKNGLQEGAWVWYWDNGQLWSKGNFKGGKKDGVWVHYNEDGTVDKEYTGTFKDGKKIGD